MSYPLKSQLPLSKKVKHASDTAIWLCLFKIWSAFIHPKHAKFWNLVHAIGDAFYTMEGFWYSNQSTFDKLRSLFSYFPF